MATVVGKNPSIGLKFPFAGVDRSDAYFQQFPREVIKGLYGRSCIQAINVRGYDPVTDRLRGGTRPAVTKAFSDRIADFLVQDLSTIVTEGTPVELSNSGRVEWLVGVAEGLVVARKAGDTAWRSTTNSASGTPPLNFTGIMQSSNLNGKKFFADGVNYVYFDPSDLSVHDWTASTAGTLPADSDNNFPRLIATWRGRLLTSGLPKDPQALFACAIDDAFDYDYARVDFSPAQAWAFATGQQGLVGDIVTGICPYTDDVCLVFCDNSIQYLAGDPGDGGKKMFITDKIGAAWGRAFCRDPYGRVYFVSNHMGIFVMSPGSLPQQISQPIEQLVEATDSGATNIILEYRHKDQTINIFYTLLSEPTATQHLCFELRTQSWYPVVFGNDDHNPLTICNFDGNLDGDREMLWGGWDGYIYQYDADAEDDDGTEIDSEVWLGPILTDTADEMILNELQGVLGETSGDVTWEVYKGRTAEEAYGSDPVKSGTLSAGRNYTHPVRIAGHAVYIRLTSTNRWAMEQIRCVIETLGIVRQRG